SERLVDGLLAVVFSLCPLVTEQRRLAEEMIDPVGVAAGPERQQVAEALVERAGVVTQSGPGVVKPTELVSVASATGQFEQTLVAQSALARWAAWGRRVGLWRLRLELGSCGQPT